MARTTTGDPITEQLKRLAQTEATAAKDRPVKRTTAARDFAAAAAIRAEAQATWERIQGQVDARRAKAIAALLVADLETAQVGELLGIDAKEVRAHEAATPDGTGRATQNAAERAVESDESAVSDTIATENQTTAA